MQKTSGWDGKLAAEQAAMFGGTRARECARGPLDKRRKEPRPFKTRRDIGLKTTQANAEHLPHKHMLWLRE